MRTLIKLFLLLVATSAVAKESSIKSFLSTSHLPEQLVTDLDLASFRNSLAPRRDLQHRNLSAFHLKKTVVDANTIVLEDSDWSYTLRIIRRGDINGDGVEDVEVCFTDKAKQASYDAQQPLLITKYSNSSMAVALKFEVDGCENYAR